MWILQGRLLGRIFHHRNGSFYLLYDFSLNAGDSWQTIAPYPSPFTLSGNSPDTILEVVVDSISSITISGIAKKVMYVHSDSNSINDIFIDRSNNKWIATFLGVYVYNDSGIVLSNKNELSKNDSEIQIFPNPFNESISLITQYEIVLYSIYSSNGERIKIQEIKQTGIPTHIIVINLGDLVSGLYFIELRSVNDYSLLKKIIKL